MRSWTRKQQPSSPWINNVYCNLVRTLIVDLVAVVYVAQQHWQPSCTPRRGRALSSPHSPADSVWPDPSRRPSDSGISPLSSGPGIAAAVFPSPDNLNEPEFKFQRRETNKINTESCDSDMRLLVALVKRDETRSLAFSDALRKAGLPVLIWGTAAVHSGY
ncbi:hypothetical protein OG21DRAFT_1512832 [Imleria badia]|nr:hypothetical protein OG21DRAFT_1512832 [Imleria badia]